MSPRPDDQPMPDAARLLAGLVAARACDPERTAEAVAEFRADDPDGEPDPAVLLDHLVQRRLVTAFQAEQALRGGSLTVGPYLLVEPTGEDEWGTVYAAVTPEDRKRFTLRVLPPDGPWQPERAQSESATHPAVPPLVDRGEADGRRYLAWPFADGESLDHSVTRVGPLGPADAARVFADLADGLAACHATGDAHGLVRPSAILLGLDRKPRLLDLGLAAALGGSPDPAADAHDLGRAMYFALTGVVADADPVPVRSRNPRVPEAVAAVLTRLMRAPSGDRPPDLRAAAAELRATGSVVVAVSATVRGAEDGAVLGRTAPVQRRATPADRSGFIDFDDLGEWAGSGSAPRPGLPEPIPDVPPAAQSTLKPTAETIEVVRPKTPSRAIPAPVGLQSGPTRTGDTARRPPVVVPEPPLFARSPVKAARSLLFWKPQADAVLLSVFGPPSIAPGQRVQFLVYAHLPEAFDGVATLCRAVHSGADLLGVGYLDRPVPRGSAVGLHLAVANAGVAKSLLTFNWTGQTQPRTFEVFVPWESPPGLASGVVSAGVADERAAAVPLHFVILPRSG